MCQNCATATQHFTDGTTPATRPLQTSVEQGTSPDWKAAIGPPQTAGAKRADEMFGSFDEDRIGNF